MISRQTKKEVILELGKKCERCGHCCTLGSGYVGEEEIPALAEALGMSREGFRRKYLDEVERYSTKVQKLRTKDRQCVLYSGGCSVQKVKPFYCRISTCGENGADIQEWYMLNYFVNPTDPESIRQWAVRLKVGRTIKGGELRELVPDAEMLKRMLEFDIMR
jgi:Fe-S-cluster containining protein